MKRAIGYLMLSAPFVAFVIWIGISVGWLDTLAIFGGSFLLIFWIAFGVILTEDK